MNCATALSQPCHSFVTVVPSNWHDCDKGAALLWHCGLMFLVDHFKAYFQSRLTQLILIFITS